MEEKKQMSREEIEEMRRKAVKMQSDANKKLREISQKERAAKSHNEELPLINKVGRFICKFASAVGKAAERAAINANKKLPK